MHYSCGVFFLYTDFNGSISILEGTSKSVVAGESARLHCMATTSESFAMRWYREGQTFNVVAYQHGVGQRVLPLKLSNVGQSASGTYVCEARRNNVTAMHTRTIVQVVGMRQCVSVDQLPFAFSLSPPPPPVLSIDYWPMRTCLDSPRMALFLCKALP